MGRERERERALGEGEEEEEEGEAAVEPNDAVISQVSTLPNPALVTALSVCHPGFLRGKLSGKERKTFRTGHHAPPVATSSRSDDTHVFNSSSDGVFVGV